jgi:hypothetical protein
LTSWSEQSTPAELSMKSALMRPPRAGEAEVAALPHDARAELAGVHADRVARPVVRVGVGLGGRLHDRADAAVPQQVDRRAQNRLDHLGRGHALLVGAERGARLDRQRDRLGRARPDAAPRRDQRSVVVVPRRAGQLEQPPPLGERPRRVRLRIDEHVPVVIGGDEPDLVREQHPVAEHVARHVADPDDGELVHGRVHAELVEVALDRLPRAARGDAELLVVVAGRAAGRERVVEPEAVLPRDPVGRVRQRRGALVGGDHQVGVDLVVDAHLRRVHHLAVDQVVGDVEQRAHVGHVLALDLGQQLRPLAGQAPDEEAALRPGGDDDRVLGQLGAHQTVDLGAVVHPVRPADPAARDPAAAQVDPLHLGRVDVDLVDRRRLRHRGHVGGAQLERRRGAVGLVGVGAQRRVEHPELVAQDAVVVERDDVVEVGEDLLAQRGLRFLIRLAGGIEARLEVAHELGRECGVRDQHVVLVALGEARAHALAVFAVGAQDRELMAVQPGRDDEPVERVALRLPAPDGGDRLRDAEPAGFHVERLAVGAEHAELLHPDLVLLADQAGGELLDHAQAEVLEHRHRLRELHLGALLVEAQAGLRRERLQAHDVALAVA